MYVTDEAIDAIMAQLESIDSDIDTKTNEIRKLKKIRRKLANSLEGLESL